MDLAVFMTTLITFGFTVAFNPNEIDSYIKSITVSLKKDDLTVQNIVEVPPYMVNGYEFNTRLYEGLRKAYEDYNLIIMKGNEKRGNNKSI